MSELKKLEGERLDNFERAFSDHTAGCRRTCNCGRTFFDGAQTYDWDDGELEALRANPTARELQYAPGDMSFEGRVFVNACDCWHARATLMAEWIDHHGHQISDW